MCSCDVLVLWSRNLHKAGFVLLLSALIHNRFSTLSSNTNMIADVITHIHASPEYLAHREGIKKESACGKCIEMETQLKEALIELSSAQLLKFFRKAKI